MARIETTGGSIAYLDQGHGEPVVLLHSSGSSGAQWRGLVARLAEARVIAPDLYGYGESSPWRGLAAFTLAHEAEAVLALIRRMGGPVHLVGHSYGGAVALHIARTRGDLLRTLTVIEPVAFHLLRGGAPADAKGLAEIEGITREVGEALACGDYERGWQRFIDYWNGSGAWAAMPAGKRDTMRGQLAKVALDFHSTLHEPVGIGPFRMVAVPTLVMRGSRTRLPTSRICERLAEALPDATLHTVDGAGHMLPLTHREPVNDLVLRHIGIAVTDQAASAASASLAAV